MSMELMIRLGAFAAVFAAVALWEVLAARRTRAYPRRQRWSHNLSLLLVDVIVLRLTLPGAAIAVALAGRAMVGAHALPGSTGLARVRTDYSAARCCDLLSARHVPCGTNVVALHRVHHSDLDFDVTTGTRFHPVEILISMVFKAAAVAAIGASPRRCSRSKCC